eukprot:c7199_g1_i1 orf=1073-1273(+)
MVEFARHYLAMDMLSLPRTRHSFFLMPRIAYVDEFNSLNVKLDIPLEMELLIQVSCRIPASMIRAS